MTLTPLLTAPLIIQIHAAAALASVLLGGAILFRRKGDHRHRVLGRLWVGLMLITALSALGIHEIRMIGPFSPIHLFSLGTVIGLWQGVAAIRRRDILGHRRAMLTTYLGALVLAGAFTLLPGRRLHDVIFGTEPVWALTLPLIAMILCLGAWLWRKEVLPLMRA